MASSEASPAIMVHERPIITAVGDTESNIHGNVVATTVDAASLINSLTPPMGTMFHGRRRYTLLDRDVAGISVRWVVDAYTYASGADPRLPDFAQKGGQIHVVLVTRGQYQSISSSCTSIVFRIDPNVTGLEPIAQLPPTGTGIQQGDDYQYTIDFEQSLSMLKNHGHEAFTFDAKYKESFGLTHAKQFGSRGKTIEFGIEATRDSSGLRSTSLYGVSVLTHTNPQAFPLELGVSSVMKFGIIGITILSDKWHLDLGFDLKQPK